MCKTVRNSPVLFYSRLNLCSAV